MSKMNSLQRKGTDAIAQYKEGNEMLESIELSALLISIIAGLFLGIPSGPALFFVLDTTLEEGKLAALKVYGGFMAAKLLYLAVALLANDFISTHQKLESVLFLIASVLLMVWGVVIIVKSKKRKDAIESKSKKKHEEASGSFYKTGFLIGVSNPVIPFIYLTVLQFIKIYANNPNTLKYLLNIAVMEAVTFLVLAGIAGILLKGGAFIQKHWNKVVMVVGVVLVCAGGYQAYHLVNVERGEIKVNNDENMLEEQLENIEEKTGSQPKSNASAGQ